MSSFFPTSKTVCNVDDLSLLLTEEYTYNTFLCILCHTVVMISG